jgi:hypothetical protein
MLSNRKKCCLKEMVTVYKYLVCERCLLSEATLFVTFWAHFFRVLPKLHEMGMSFAYRILKSPDILPAKNNFGMIFQRHLSGTTYGYIHRKFACGIIRSPQSIYNIHRYQYILANILPLYLKSVTTWTPQFHVVPTVSSHDFLH